VTLILSKTTQEKTAKLLTNTKQKIPLVHCITNRVTMTDCANGLLAAGAAPIMAEDLREVEDIVSISSALVLNIGTLVPFQIESMLAAGKKAKKIGIPIIFDPVGAGATKLRDTVSKQIIEEVQPDIIRGNMSEIRALYGFSGHTKGVEAAASDAVTLDNAYEASHLVKEAALKFNCIVGATGEVDIISDGRKTYYVANGHPMLCKITGSGCVLSSLVGGYAGAVGLADKEKLLDATVAAFVLSGLAGEIAHGFVEKNKGDRAGLGTFHTKYMDALSSINENDFLEKSKIYVYDE
jgi:hydroxyethylthiazole kinase